MSLPLQPKLAKLVIGLFLNDKTLFNRLALELTSAFGSMDIITSWMRFDYTNYYESEMGSPLFRRLATFQTLVKQGDLAKIKLTTNRFEEKWLRDGRRTVNIDPGYLLHERFVLASAKNFSHRIYIGHGIYADLTLIYQNGDFKKLPWTYPDYADKPIITFLTNVRNKYIVDLKRIS